MENNEQEKPKSDTTMSAAILIADGTNKNYRHVTEKDFAHTTCVRLENKK